jgi:hypothetical protein
MSMAVGATAASASVVGRKAVAYTTTTTTPTCIITAKPSAKFIESGLGATASSVAFVLEVECQPVYSEQYVEIFTPQLNNACHDTLSWYSLTGDAGLASTGTGEDFNVFLDDDGNATAVVWGGPSCAATKDLIQADLTVAPYTTADVWVTIAPPVTTAPGLIASPGQEVEDSLTSSVATIFYAEFPSTYGEDTVEFADSQLYDQCHGSITWVGPDETVLGTGTKSVTTTLDNNGNAWVVALAGPSCATGKSQAVAELLAPPYKTYTTSFTILSPRVTV